MTFLKCWALILLTIGTGEEVRLKQLVEQSAPLVAGSTEGDVLALLGEPDLSWEARRGVARFFLGERPAQWIYGTTIDLKYLIIPELPFPNPISLKLRLFDPDEHDLVIEWAEEKAVSAVRRPEIDVPDELATIYEPAFFFGDLARALRPTPSNGAVP
jgi:hypothetical protein